MNTPTDDDAKEIQAVIAKAIKDVRPRDPDAFSRDLLVTMERHGETNLPLGAAERQEVLSLGLYHRQLVEGERPRVLDVFAAAVQLARVTDDVRFATGENPPFLRPTIADAGDDALRRLDDLISAHLVDAIARFAGEPVRRTTMLRERVSAFLTILYWAYDDARIAPAQDHLARRVHDFYVDYRRSMGDPEGLDLPGEDFMGLPLAIKYLDRLERRLQVLHGRQSSRDPYHTAKWFAEFVGLDPASLRQAARRTPDRLRRRGRGARTEYRYTDVRDLWPARVPRTPPAEPLSRKKRAS